MSETTLPKPLAAYVGLLVASLEDARGSGRSPAAQVVRLPLATVGQLLTARQRYDELAVTGDVVADAVVGIVRQRFGAGSVEAADWIGDEFASARKKAGAAAATTSDLVDKTSTKIGTFGGTKSNGASSKFEQLAEEFETVVDDHVTEPLQQAADRLAAAAPVDEPAVEVTPEARVEPVTPPTPMQQLESFSVDPAIGAEAGGLKASGDLPLKDFDHMSGPQLRGRLRALDRVQLVQLLDYERAHANRVGIILLLENRLTKMNAAG